MPTATRKHRVLVVDDNHDSANSMGYLLEAAGFEVETCYDGPSAVEAARRKRPDACVLDIAMPGMDGYELARQLRELSPDRPPVMATMTAYEDYAHLERAVDAGFDLQFTKPADHREVAAELELCVRNGTTFNDRGEQATAGEQGSVVRRLLARLVGLWSKPGPADGGTSQPAPA